MGILVGNHAFPKRPTQEAYPRRERIFDNEEPAMAMSYPYPPVPQAMPDQGPVPPQRPGQPMPVPGLQMPGPAPDWMFGGGPPDPMQTGGIPGQPPSAAMAQQDGRGVLARLMAAIGAGGGMGRGGPRAESAGYTTSGTDRSKGGGMGSSARGKGGGLY